MPEVYPNTLWGKTTVEECEKIDILDWMADGMFDPGRWSGFYAYQGGGIAYQYLILPVEYTGERWVWLKHGVYDYRVQLVPTPCHFGGVRYWFLCPGERNAVPCRRRVRILYTPKLRGGIYACRHCYDLVYWTQQQSGCRWYAFIRGATELRRGMDRERRWKKKRERNRHRG